MNATEAPLSIRDDLRSDRLCLRVLELRVGRVVEVMALSTRSSASMKDATACVLIDEAMVGFGEEIASEEVSEPLNDETSDHDSENGGRFGRMIERDLLEAKILYQVSRCANTE